MKTSVCENPPPSTNYQATLSTTAEAKPNKIATCFTKKRLWAAFGIFNVPKRALKKKTLKGGHDFMEKIGGDKKYGEQKQPHLEDSRRSEVVWFFDQIIREDL